MEQELVRHTEKLYYFREIAQIGSLQATARKLGMSAPTLSYSVKQLEAVSGVQLFERSRKGIKTTPAGERLLSFCERFFRELEEVSQFLAHPEKAMPTKIKVGTFQSIAIYFWPLLLDSLKGNRQISLSMRTNRSNTILESLVRKEIDIAVTVEALKHPNIIRHELYRDDYAFYAAKNLSLKRVRKQDLSAYNLLYMPDAYDESRKTLRQYVRSWGLEFSDEFEIDSFEVIGEFVRRGIGIGMMPTLVGRSLGSSVEMIRIEGTRTLRFGNHRFFMSYRDDLDIPQSLMNTFLESAKNAVEQFGN